MNAQKRRQKQMDHRREIERLLEERRAKYESERAAELQEQIDGERVEQIRQQIIEEERKRMLAAHAKNLGLQHLPKGVLSNDQERPVALLQLYVASAFASRLGCVDVAHILSRL